MHGACRRQFVEAQKVQLKGKTGRADVALAMINKQYGIKVNRRMSAMSRGLSVVRSKACRSSASERLAGQDALASHAAKRAGQGGALSVDGQRARALYVVVPLTGAVAACLVGRGL